MLLEPVSPLARRVLTPWGGDHYSDLGSMHLFFNCLTGGFKNKGKTSQYYLSRFRHLLAGVISFWEGDHVSDLRVTATRIV